MGIGGSTTAVRSESTIMVEQRPQTEGKEEKEDQEDPIPARPTTSCSSPYDHRPTKSCCRHHRENHATFSHSAVVSASAKRPSIDDDIEEIVANTVDLATNNNANNNNIGEIPDRTVQITTMASSRVATPIVMTEVEEISRVSRNSFGSTRRIQGAEQLLQMEQEVRQDNMDALDPLPEVDFAKFKKVNHTGTTVQRNGKRIHHQESDLLWRLGLISPEAYTLTKTRSAPHSQDYLKTPSYDMTEEQLMANIEKEFTGCTSAI